MKRFLKTIFAGVIVCCMSFTAVLNCYAGETIVQYDVKNDTRTVYELEENSTERVVIEPITGVLGEAYSEPANTNNGISTWSIIGTDDRTLVSNPNSRPYVAIAYLTAVFPNGEEVYCGTGFMISEYTLATAGHCLYDNNRGGWATAVIAEFGKAGTSSYLKVEASHTEHIYYDNNYSSVSATDYAFVEFDVAVGFLVGSFGIDTGTPLGDYLAVAGYPCDLNSGRYMYIAYGDAVNINTDTFTYDIDTYNGDSGAPVFYRVGSNGVVKAIHLGYIGSYNIGRRFTTTLVNWLLEKGLLEG